MAIILFIVSVIFVSPLVYFHAKWSVDGTYARWSEEQHKN